MANNRIKEASTKNGGSVAAFVNMLDTKTNKLLVAVAEAEILPLSQQSLLPLRRLGLKVA